MGTRLILLLVAVLATACGRSALPDAAVPLTIGLAQMPATLDPRYGTDAASVRVQALIHRGLVRLDEHFMPQPDLAADWEYVSPTMLRFHLRRGVRFHDGRVVRAEDVAATLNAVRDPAMASPLRSGLAAIVRIVVEDEQTLRIELGHADASLLVHLDIGILPEELAQGPQQARRTIGCGAYRVAGWTDESGLKLRPIRPDRFELRFLRVKDPVTRVLKVVRGELDLIQNDLPPYLIDYLQQRPEVQVRIRPSTTFSYLGLNLQDPVLRDVRVRRALALALDRRKLKRALMADLPRLAETVLPPEHWASVPLASTPFDPERARRLLDEAGWTPGPDGVRFRLSYRTSTDPLRLRLAAAIAAMWKQVGVQTRIESMEWGGFYGRIKRGDFQVYALSWVGISDPDIYRWILHSSMWPPVGANRGRFSDPDVDAWLDRARLSVDSRERRAWYAKVQHRMHEDFVYIPLWYEAVVAVAGPRARAFRPRADGSLLGLLQLRRQVKLEGSSRAARSGTVPS